MDGSIWHRTRDCADRCIHVNLLNWIHGTPFTGTGRLNPFSVTGFAQWLLFHHNHDEPHLPANLTGWGDGSQQKRSSCFIGCSSWSGNVTVIWRVMSVSREGIQRFSVVDSCVLWKCDRDQKERAFVPRPDKDNDNPMTGLDKFPERWTRYQRASEIENFMKILRRKESNSAIPVVVAQDGLSRPQCLWRIARTEYPNPVVNEETVGHQNKIQTRMNRRCARA